MSDAGSEPETSAAERPGLFIRLRGHLSLSRVQATLGIIAAVLSIGGALYGYLRPSRTASLATEGTVVAIVREATSRKPVTDATLELLTVKDVLLTDVPSTGGEVRRKIKEGTYRLRVTHPKYVTQTRQIQVVAGQTAEIRFQLEPRPSDSPLEGLKKIFR